MTELLVSKAALADFERRLKCLDERSCYIESSLEVRVDFERISIFIFQPERYDQRIECGVGIMGSDVRFSWDELSPEAFKPLRKQEDSIFNDTSVAYFLDYVEKNFSDLTSWPPPWFISASYRQIMKIKSIFPSIAAQTELAHATLFQRWSNAQG